MTDISHAAPMTLVCLAAMNNYGKANWALSIVFTVYLVFYFIPKAAGTMTTYNDFDGQFQVYDREPQRL